MFGAVPIEAVDSHYDGEFLAWFGAGGKTDGDGDGSVHFFCAGLGVVVRDEFFGQRSFVVSAE